MFQTSVMNYTSRVDIAARIPIGDAEFAHDYARFKRIAAPRDRHLRKSCPQVVERFEAEQEKTRAWRKILEQTTSTLLRQSAQE